MRSFVAAVGALLLVMGVTFAPAIGHVKPDGGRWKIVHVDAPGPYVDLISGPDGAMWLTSRSVAGFIRVDATGRTRIFRTPGFTPSYIASVGDGRVWAVSIQRPHAVGAVTTSGQLTIYVQPSTIERLPATKIVPNVYETVRYASVGQLVGMGGQPGFTDPGGLPYSSGLTANDDVALLSLPNSDIWFTECCLANGHGIAGNVPYFAAAMVEYPLPYAQCSHPAGIAGDTQGLIYVACPGHDNSIVAVVNPATGATTAMPFPVDYATTVNTEAGAPDGNVYFTPGTSARLWAFDPAKERFVSYATPDGSIPTAIALSRDSTYLWMLAGSRRQVDVFRM